MGIMQAAAKSLLGISGESLFTSIPPAMLYLQKEVAIRGLRGLGRTREAVRGWIKSFEASWNDTMPRKGPGLRSK